MNYYNNNKFRFWEIDFLRGIAVVMMIVYHLFFDMKYLNVYNFSLDSIYWQIFLYPIGIIFLLLVGISLYLSYTRSKKFLTSKGLKVKFVKRGVKIFSLGLIITIFTWFYIGEGFIIFGVLHCIGLSILLSSPFIKRTKTTFFLGFLLIIFGVILKNFRFDFSWLLWLGFIPKGFYSLDYFPLLPWFGVVLLGIFLGGFLYKNYRRVFRLRDMTF